MSDTTIQELALETVDGDNDSFQVLKDLLEERGMSRELEFLNRGTMLAVATIFHLAGWKVEPNITSIGENFKDIFVFRWTPQLYYVLKWSSFTVSRDRDAFFCQIDAKRKLKSYNDDLAYNGSERVAVEIVNDHVRACQTTILDQYYFEFPYDRLDALEVVEGEWDYSVDNVVIETTDEHREEAKQIWDLAMKARRETVEIVDKFERGLGIDMWGSW